MPGTIAEDVHKPWDARVTYVVGHQRPDTDAIASALGYAWLPSSINTGGPEAINSDGSTDMASPYPGGDGGSTVVAARAGQIGEQARFALRRFDQAAPPLLALAAPTFGHASRPLEPLSADAPIASAFARLALGERVVPVVDEDDKPLGGIGVQALARAYFASVGASSLPYGDAAATVDAAAAAAAIPALPPLPLCRDLIGRLPGFRAGERISDHRTRSCRCCLAGRTLRPTCRSGAERLCTGAFACFVRLDGSQCRGDYRGRP